MSSESVERLKRQLEEEEIEENQRQKQQQKELLRKRIEAKLTELMDIEESNQEAYDSAITEFEESAQTFSEGLDIIKKRYAELQSKILESYNTRVLESHAKITEIERVLQEEIANYREATKQAFESWSRYELLAKGLNQKIWEFNEWAILSRKEYNRQIEKLNQIERTRR